MKTAIEPKMHSENVLACCRTFVTFRHGMATLATGDMANPGPGQVRVRTLFTALSNGTELCQLFDRFIWWDTNRPDRCPGYSAVAVVESVGSEVREPVVGEVIYCQTHHSSLALLDPTRHIWAPLPVGLDPEAAAFTTLWAIGLAGVRRLDLQLGERVLVVGDGLIGLSAAFFALRSGAVPVVMMGRHARRLAVAASLGSHILESSGNRPESCADRFPAVVVAAPTTTALKQACDACEPNGRIVLLATYPDALRFHPWFDGPQRKGIDLRFCHQPLTPRADQLRDRALILRGLAEGWIPGDKLITHRLPHVRAAEAYRLAQCPDEALGIILDWTRDH